MIVSTGRFPTLHASKYLQQLCRHFAHKVEVRFDEAGGEVPLATGPATLSADAAELVVHVTAEDAKGLIDARYVIDKHLVTFAFREEFSGFAWTAPQPV
jgi:hypothetical protein